MVTTVMLYFMAAHFCEERERAGQAPEEAAFLLADDAAYRACAAAACRRAPSVAAADAAGFAGDVGRALERYNLCGLGDSRRRNMYPYLGST
jgi:FADH2 O2-dependent halogenase